MSSRMCTAYRFIKSDEIIKHKLEYIIVKYSIIYIIIANIAL